MKEITDLKHVKIAMKQPLTFHQLSTDQKQLYIDYEYQDSWF